MKTLEEIIHWIFYIMWWRSFCTKARKDVNCVNYCGREKNWGEWIEGSGWRDMMSIWGTFLMRLEGFVSHDSALLVELVNDSVNGNLRRRSRKELEFVIYYNNYSSNYFTIIRSIEWATEEWACPEGISHVK